MTSYRSDGTPPGQGEEVQGPAPGDQPATPMSGYAPPPAQPQQVGSGPQPTQFGPAPSYVPAPSGPQVGAVGVAPPRRRSPWLIIGGIVLGLVLLCGIGAALLFSTVINATQPMANGGEAFMTAIRDGDYNKAYSLCTPALQQELKSADDLKAAMGAKQPTSWSFTSRAINNGQGTLSGTTQYKDATTVVRLTWCSTRSATIGRCRASA